MARYRKRMTPEQFAAAVAKMHFRMSDNRIQRVYSTFAKRFQNSIKRRISAGKNATGTAMEPLKQITIEAIATDELGNPIGVRGDRGQKPLKFTGQLHKNVKALPHKNGFVVFIANEFKQKVAHWQANTNSGEDIRIHVTPKMQRYLAAVKNIKVSVGSIITRAARVPIALSGKQIKTSVKELNIYILQPFK